MLSHLFITYPLVGRDHHKKASTYQDERTRTSDSCSRSKYITTIQHPVIWIARFELAASPSPRAYSNQAELYPVNSKRDSVLLRQKTNPFILPSRFLGLRHVAIPGAGSLSPLRDHDSQIGFRSAWSAHVSLLFKGWLPLGQPPNSSVWTVRFELTLFCSQSRRITKLSYIQLHLAGSGAVPRHIPC